MMRTRAILILLATLVGACSSHKMAELVPFDPVFQARTVWSESVGKAKDYPFEPAVFGASVYATGNNGSLIRIDEGKVIWETETETTLSAGVGTDGNLVAVASPDADLLAFSAADGKLLWKVRAPSEILAPPVIGSGLIIVRGSDNSLSAYDISDGRRKWLYQRPAPPLVLRMTAPPVIDGNYVFAGFPGGKLLAIKLDEGIDVWEGTVALPKGTTELERVADIASAPVMSAYTLCAVAFQGRVACFNLNNGNLLWARDISSAAGLAIDSRYLFVTDDKGAVHALDLSSGASVWKQDALATRRTTAPLPRENVVVVADGEGVVHFLNREDGAFVARTETDGSAVLTAPRLLEEGVLIQTSEGGIYAIELEPMPSDVYRPEDNNGP